MKPKILSIITQKGGVGKTTSAIHIAGALEQINYKVLLIDFDTQKNLSLGYNVPKDFDFDIEDFLLSDKKPKFVQRGKNNGVFIIPGSANLKEKKLKNTSLKKAIANLDEKFDYIIIDCPPKPINDELSLGEIAVFASDYVISPIRADKYSIAGISSFISSINSLKQNSGLKVSVLGFFFNEVEENTNHFTGFYEALSKSPAGQFLFKNYIRKDVTVKNAMDEGKTIFEIKPYGRASRDFKYLTEEIEIKIYRYEK
jgi:chromosome partitioning protein